MSSTPRSRPLSGVLFAALVIAILIAAFLVAIAVGLNPAQAVTRVVDSFFPPVAATNQGASIRQLYDVVFIIAAIIFFVVEGLILWTVLRYRRRPGDDELPPQTHGNTLAEALWTIIPTIIVAFLFVISWGTLNGVESLSATPELKVRAFAAQFQWQFDYYDESGENIVYTQLVPQGEGGGMALPVDQNVRIVLESRDVIHAFYVPQFLFKRDVVPGRVSEFDITIKPEDAGKVFGGQCAELCGSGHRLMTFEVHAMTRADFDVWLQEHIDQAPPPPPSGEPPGSGEPPAHPASRASRLNRASPRRRTAEPTPSSRSTRSTPPSTRPSWRWPRTSPSRSSSSTRIRCRTTSRSTRARRPGPPCSPARSSRAPPRSLTTCRRCPPGRMASYARSTRT